ncbi:MAG: hypothetical protein GY829_01000 [Gammaproteobacteria bacterium]|nr:hypothetical protein [Gammaproteobacteria bacterium]
MSKPVDKRHKQDQELFSEAMVGIEPLKQDKIIPSSEKNRVFTPRENFIESKAHIDLLSDEYDPFENDEQRNDLNYHHQSISKKQFRTLKKQSFNRELILDLHGINRPQARSELIEFLQYCKEHDYRQVAIMPGQGYGILRQALNIWLRQLPEVLAFAESPQRSGGRGVIRVLLASQQ